MTIHFSKYHGAGNDFIMVDGRTTPKLKAAHIHQMCDRHFGIGADGFIVVEENNNADYEMIYFNSDGNIGSMCGNGARCAAVYATEKGITHALKIKFKAYDGIHFAELLPGRKVRVSMSDVLHWKTDGGNFIIDSGSPHFVKYVFRTEGLDVMAEGKKIRYSNEYKKEGINVNFVSVDKNKIHMRTYERGVEAETLACGTGTVAVALSHLLKDGIPGNGKYDVEVVAIGGELKVQAEFLNGVFKNIFLTGPAEKVFEGSYAIL